VRPTLLISMSAILLGTLGAAAAEEQSWSKHTPPPVKFASPPAEHKPQDWSGVYVGVTGGASFSRSGRDSAAPGSSALPR
jgi:hypothetical protein